MVGIVIYLGPHYGRGNEDNGDLLQRVPCTHCYTQCPQPCSRPVLTHASTGDCWTLRGKSGSISCGVTASFSWCMQDSVCDHQEFVSQSCVSFGGSMVGLMVTSSKSIIPYPSLMHPEPLPLQQSTADPYLFRRHSNTVLPESLGPGAHKVCLNPLSICGRYGVWF